MKKFLYFSIIFLTIWVFGLSNVSAQELSWDSLCDEYIDLYGNIQNTNGDDNLFDITKTEDSLIIDLEKDELSYNIKFNYDDSNKVISYINDRDYSKMSLDSRLLYSFADSMLFQEVTSSILDSYGLDTDDLNSLEEIDAIKVVNTSATKTNNFLEIAPEDIKEIYIDLVKIDNYLSSNSNAVIESEIVAPNLHAANTESNSNNDLSDDNIDNQESDKDSINDNVVSNESNNNTVNGDSSELNTNSSAESNNVISQDITNPKTLDLNSRKYLLFIVVSFIGICVLMFKLAKKTKFNN